MKRILSLTALLMLALGVFVSLSAQGIVTVDHGTALDVTNPSPTNHETWSQDFSSSDTDAAMPYNDRPDGLYSVTIGSGNQISRMPVDFFYKNSMYQCLYYQSELGSTGNIISITLFNQFVSNNVTNKPLKIWMGVTDLQDLSAGWVPISEMTLVYDGRMSFPALQNRIVFQFQAPFDYAGGNIVLMFNRPMDNVNYSSNDYFKTQTGVAGRARNLFSDTSTYDPANLTGGTLTGSFPKITFSLATPTGPPVFLLGPTQHHFGDVNIGTSRSKIFNIMNVGGGSLGIDAISIAGSPAMSISQMPTLPATLGAGESAALTVTYTPTGLGVHNATLTVTDNLGTRHTLGSLNHTDSREAHTAQVSGSGVHDITIGIGNENARIPLDFFYRTSLFETIYTADEMNNFIGAITGIKLYTQFSTEIMARPVQIWMGRTTQNDLTQDWIPSTQLTQVFDSTVNFPFGENVVHINFQEPYLYLEGGNLVLMVFRPFDGQYYSSTCTFKSQTTGLGRSRNLYSDSATYFPATPPDAQITAQFPKITFLVIPGQVGDITGTVLGVNNTPLAGVQVNVLNRNYSAVTDAQGQFSISNLLSDHYSVTFSRHGYVSQTINIFVDEDETEVMNVSMNLMPNVNVIGSILASDTGSGIAGANITLTGYENYSGSSIANGSFSIPTVFSGYSYAYTISASGYTSTSGSIEVGASSLDMGSITLTEVAFAPTGVVAAQNAAFNAINLSWEVPDPNAIEITEGFEAVGFPPEGWDQVITNSGPANAAGVFPTWCKFGNISIPGSGNIAAPEGTKQVGLWWDYNHQDEWLLSPTFNCPSAAHLSFDTYATLGSVNDDHYYVQISTDAGESWITLWDATAQAAGENFYAYPITIDLTAYAGMVIKLAFHASDPPADTGLWYVWLIDNIYIGNLAEGIRFAGSDLISMPSLALDSNAGSGNTPMRASRDERQQHSMTPHSSKKLGLPSRSPNRALVGYQVWRLAAGQENNENSWISITEDLISALNYVDNDWTTLPDGTYKWAVKAVYTADVISTPAFSNNIVKQIGIGTIVGFVRKQNNQGLAGARVSAAGGYTTTTNNAGAYSLVVPAGTYSITATARDYADFTYENITVAPSQNTTVNFIMTPTSNADDFLPVTVTALKGNFPNPFNPETTISYDLKEAGKVRLEVYNVKGQLVRSLVMTDQPAGRYHVVFNGRDDNDNMLSSGIYLYRFSSENYHSTRKMMLME